MRFSPRARPQQLVVQGVGGDAVAHHHGRGRDHRIDDGFLGRDNLDDRAAEYDELGGAVLQARHDAGATPLPDWDPIDPQPGGHP
ncbi:hypothetical protein [Nocardia sp. NPDC058114]|uniref:hypothetical protein n=1 Tax=Nocardia sp. NPDC058114 TaxID=3346346 RepID=UPI0036DC92F2